MRILVWGINYAPEVTGIGPYNTVMCEYLQAQGHDVEMVTTFSYYPAWKKRPEDRATFWREAMAVARALSQRLHPVKMNYEIHGNTLPHLHMHLLPRQPDDAFVGRPIDLKEFHHRYTETDIELLKAVVRSAALAEA